MYLMRIQYFFINEDGHSIITMVFVPTFPLVWFHVFSKWPYNELTWVRVDFFKKASLASLVASGYSTKIHYIQLICTLYNQNHPCYIIITIKGWKGYTLMVIPRWCHADTTLVNWFMNMIWLIPEIYEWWDRKLCSTQLLCLLRLRLINYPMHSMY